jgi:hypothetical protein
MSDQHNAAPTVSPDTMKLRLLASLIDDAAAEEGDTRYQALCERYEEVCEHILARPVRSWSDVAEIAEIAHFLAGKDTGGELLALASPCHDDRIAAELILAVLTMAKGAAHA